MSLADFLNMGGYAFYVWSSWGLALVILIANFVGPLQREKQLLRELAQRERRRTR
jgi:heme exporter protein D